MSDLGDLFPGFGSRFIDTEAGRLFARVAGQGPPLVLLHGYPQTHVEWHRIAPALAERHTVVLPDLRGHGWSAAPRSRDGEAYTKRLMADDIVSLMERLGHIRFSVVGHDRGGRVAYRLALDHPGRVEKVAVLDIVPTGAMWAGMGAALAMRTYHWLFLAQPEPLPETLIGRDPVFYLDWTLASWTQNRDLSAFDPRALAHYRAGFNEPSRIHAMCEDYRAGATLDRAHDDADRAAGKRITRPLLALWGRGGIPAQGVSPLDVWRDWASDVRGGALDCGHFLPEEAPEQTLAALRDFL